MPSVTVLVGLPGCGKSTWRKEHALAGMHVYSTDDILERMAAEQNTTYDAVWAGGIKAATREANINLAVAIKSRWSVIADRTNLTVGGRRKLLAQFPKTYTRKAVVFMPPKSLALLNDRLTGRPGKTISRALLERMAATFEVPTFEEGFRDIEFVNF